MVDSSNGKVFESNGIWSVQLGENHEPYKVVKLKRRHGEDVTRVLVVKTNDLILLYENDMPAYVIPAIELWNDDKRDGIRDFLNPKDGFSEMANLSPFLRRVEFKKGFWIFKKKISRDLKAVTFTNGRHRTRYLHAAGAEYIPVEVPKGQVDLLRSYLNELRSNIPL